MSPTALRWGVALAALGMSPEAVAQTRTPWEMNAGEGLVRLTTVFPSNGDRGEYAFARIPPPTDRGWGPAPDPNSIGFDVQSTLCAARAECRAALEFTYFRAVICIPDPRDLRSVTVRLGDVDDGARVTVFNSVFPAGITPDNGFASLGGGTVSSGNFANALRVGEPNTLVITHVDDCCSSSFLRDVEVLANDRPLPATAPRELCNLLDDDCDGAVDEDLGSTTCGVGACVVTTPNCLRGLSLRCVPGMPTPEVCNGIDDDCDGEVDEALGTESCGQGVCERTVPRCVGGRARVCVPGDGGAEVCNGYDDDCNGEIDDVADGGRAACTLNCHDPTCDPSLRLQGRAGPLGDCQCTAPMGSRSGQFAWAVSLAAGLCVCRRRRRE